MHDADKSKEQLLEELAQLRQRQDVLSSMMHGSPDTIVLSRLSDGRILEVNDGFTRNSGYAREQAIGRTTAELKIWVNAEDRDRFVSILRESGRCLNFAAQFRARDGRLIHGLISASLIEVEDEVCLFSNTRNITELMSVEERLRESEGRFRSVVGSLSEGLLITDIDDVVLDLNERMTELTGFSTDELKGKTAHRLLLSADQWPNLPERSRRRLSGEAETYEVEIRRKDGSSFWAQVSASPYRNTAGKVVGTLGAMSDITETQTARSGVGTPGENDGPG